MGQLIKLRQIITSMFESFGVDKTDADWLLVDVLKIKRQDLNKDLPVTKSQINKVYKLAKKRCKGLPLSQVLGKANFYGYDFIVNKNVLSPRMETELLVEEIIKTKGLKHGLDIGCGSGIIPITLSLEANMFMTAVDVSCKALSVAKKNAKLYNVYVEFIKSDLFNNIKNKKFDFIVSNPPYIKSEDIKFLDREVRHDPMLALDGGKDGLIFYKKIIEKSPQFLNDGGYIFFEVGINQASDVAKLLEKDFYNIEIIKDYNKIERIVKAKIRPIGE